MKIYLKNLIIRKVKQTDIGLMTVHRLTYLSELQGAMEDDYRIRLKNELSEFFIDEIQKGTFLALVAEYEGEVVGYGAIVIRNIPGDRYQSSYKEGDILNMYTVSEARRQGVSSKILEQLLEEARNMKISKLALHTSKDGEQLYRKFGFSDPVYPVLELSLK